MRGRPLTALALEDVDQEVLERWVMRPKTAQALAIRARIVLRAGLQLYYVRTVKRFPVRPARNEQKTFTHPRHIRVLTR